MTILLSAESGSGETDRFRSFLEELLKARGIEPRIEIVHGAEARAAARRALARGEDVVVAGGGDGTVSAIASTLVGTSAALGVLPLGTLNHFARDAGIPVDLEAAAITLVSGRTAEVDVGEVNGRYFVNNSSLGLYPNIVLEREQRRRRGWKKWVALVWASAGVFRRFPFVQVRIDVAGARIALSTPFVFIGNNEYEVEGLRIGRRSRLDSGLLWLYVAPHHASRWGLLWAGLKALMRRVRFGRDIYAACATETWVNTSRKHIRVALDGEVVVMEPPLHYRTRARALRVIVPAEEQR